MDDNVMTSGEVCRNYGFSLNMLNKLEKEGKLVPCWTLPLNRKRFYKAEDVEIFIDSVRTCK